MRTVAWMVMCGTVAVAATLVLVHVGPRHTGLAIAVLASLYLGAELAHAIRRDR